MKVLPRRRLLSPLAATALALPLLVVGPAAGAAGPVAAAVIAAAAPTVQEPAPLPPLGWNSWNTFYCNVDEQMVRQTADAMVSTGMAAAGYQYVVVDDCWMQDTRDANGNLRARTDKFPSGMKALGDYIHGKGLRFGLYHAPREKTCNQYSGTCRARRRTGTRPRTPPCSRRGASTTSSTTGATRGAP